MKFRFWNVCIGLWEFFFCVSVFGCSFICLWDKNSVYFYYQDFSELHNFNVCEIPVRIYLVHRNETFTSWNLHGGKINKYQNWIWKEKESSQFFSLKKKTTPKTPYTLQYWTKTLEMFSFEWSQQISPFWWSVWSRGVN